MGWSVSTTWIWTSSIPSWLCSLGESYRFYSSPLQHSGLPSLGRLQPPESRAEALDAIQLGRLNQLAVDSLYPPKLDCIFLMVSLSFFCTFIFSSRRVLSAEDGSVSDLQWPKSPWRFWLIFCFVAVHTGKKKAKALRLSCASLTHHTELPQLPPWLPNRKSLSWEHPHTVKYSVLEFEGAFPCTHQHLFSLSLYLLTRVNLYSNSAWPHFFLFFPK